MIVITFWLLIFVPLSRLARNERTFGPSPKSYQHYHHATPQPLSSSNNMMNGSNSNSVTVGGVAANSFD
jgi:hypothetical protein